MKRFLVLILSSIILCTTVGCSSKNTTDATNTASTTSPTKTTATETTKTTSKPAEITASTTAVKQAMDGLEERNYEGVAYVVKDGEVVGSYAKGTMENGDPITIDTPMPITNGSNQFCAVAVLLLQEQGKLSVEDTLEKYFPEYEIGKNIRLKDMLSMRSGIFNFTDYPEEGVRFTSPNKTEEENTAELQKWIFSKELDFQPNEKFSYSNSNYVLLANIVEQVSGKKYIDFLRENFFEPLGMTNTVSFCELSLSLDWVYDNKYGNFGFLPEEVKGGGDIISNSADMVLWMDALRSGKIISPESYEAMTTDYSNMGYGYGTEVDFFDGAGYIGQIGDYNSVDYIGKYDDILIFMASDSTDPAIDKGMLSSLIMSVMEQ